MLYTGTLAVMTCYKCGISFAMPQDYKDRRIADHESFWCPAGHSQCFHGKSEADRLRDDLARQKHYTEQAQASASYERSEREAVTRRLTATRGVVTRHKNRISKGRCPCCSHTFKDLKTHMTRQHPKWNPIQETQTPEARDE